MRARLPLLLVILAIALMGAGESPGSSPVNSAETPARLFELDCRDLSATEVAEVLARVPAPRVILLQGSVPIVTMEPFAAFLEAMGYPKERLADPASGKRSRSSFIDSRRLAGQIAWHYEQEGMMPMLIGHSQGGMIVIKLLHDLAGTRSQEPIPVWHPQRDAPEPRTSIVDPLTGKTLEVTQIKVEYAAALATGSLPRLLLGQWGMLPLLRDVPDTVVEFTGFAIPWDPIAGTGAEPASFHATGSARVRNIVLPTSYSHIDLPRANHLAGQPAVRAWIEAYRPGSNAPLPSAQDSSAGIGHADLANLLHAADIWYSVKQHWCEGAQRLAAARRDTAGR